MEVVLFQIFLKRENIMNQFNWLTTLTAAIALVVTTSTADAVPTIDGTASVADGYTSLSVQNTDTGFGNATSGDPVNGGGGSEIDQVFGKIENGRLYMVFAGNLETNFNKLDVWIDSVAGGQHTINGSTLPDGVDSYCCGTSDALKNSSNLTFDAGVSPDYFMSFTSGFESVRPGTPDELKFYAASAHYADLTQGTNGAVVAAGMQLAQRGLPQVLRGTTADFDQDGNVDGGEFLTWQRNYGATGATRLQGDASGDGIVGPEDLTTWQAAYGFDVATTPYNLNFFAPQNSTIDKSDILLGPALPGLAQGDLIDKNYAMGAGGCDADSSGTGCLTRELEFALPVDTLNDPSNTFSHRNFDNSIGLQMAFDNSNTVGVEGNASNGGDYSIPTMQNPGDVISGIEFSIPLSQIGNPAALSDIRIVGYITNGDHNYLSNQFAGDGILLGNLGADGSGAGVGNDQPLDPQLDLGFLPGNQYVTLTVPAPPANASAVPEPTSLVLLAFAASALVGCRRR